MYTTSLFKELVLISLGKLEQLSHCPTETEWKEIFALANKQSLVGICFSALDKLPPDQRPPKEILFHWIGQSEQIKAQNELANKRAKELSKLFTDGGYRSIVLKGQGIALLYPHPEMRTSGDIDLWVEGKRHDVIRFIAHNGWALGDTVIHHTDADIFPDVSVEVHFWPSYAFDPFRWRKYKKWFREQGKTQFQLFDGNVGYAHPSLEFNAVYVLLHIYRHVFHEGIGLRQLLDYYYVLQHLTKEDRCEAMRTLKWMGLGRFAAAVMYVESSVFELDASKLLFTPDKEAGEFLLNEIMRAGNFGKYDSRIKEAHSGGALKLYFHKLAKLFDMLRFYPSEVLWAPFWKIGHWAWRKIHNY